MRNITRTGIRACALVIVATSLGGCSLFGISFGVAQLSPKECLMRAMYFESNRSSADGMLAVGTVVMNQFAQGVLTRKMTDSGAVLASQMADQVMSGARHPGVQNAQHFHTAGLRFPYNNMHYVLEAGGNEFYEKY